MPARTAHAGDWLLLASLELQSSDSIRKTLALLDTIAQLLIDISVEVASVDEVSSTDGNVRDRVAPQEFAN
jgi:hypothetical protein